MDGFDLKSLSTEEIRNIRWLTDESGPFGIILRNHALGHHRRRLRSEARYALLIWLLAYSSLFRDIDGKREIVHSLNEYYSIGYLLQFARSYHWMIEKGARPSAHLLQPPTDSPMADFARDFELLCASTSPADGHVLVWRTLASFCRATADEAWRHLVNPMDESTGVEYPANYEPGSGAWVADITMSDEEYDHCRESHRVVAIMEAFGIEEFRGDTEEFLRRCGVKEELLDSEEEEDDPAVWCQESKDKIEAWGDLNAAAAEFCSPEASKLRPKEVREGLESFCTNVCETIWRTGSHYVGGPHLRTLTERGRSFLYGLRALESEMPHYHTLRPTDDVQDIFAREALQALRAFVHLIRTPDCKLVGSLIAWLFHIIRLRCEWEIAEIMSA